jgi:hypothetical protein
VPASACSKDTPARRICRAERADAFEGGSKACRGKVILRVGCAHCGAILDIPLTNDPRVAIHAASGKPNIRTLTLDGKEIHACEIREDDAGSSATRLAQAQQASGLI